MSYLLFVILITLLASAFFSGMEIAFLASNKLRLELERKQGLFSSRIVGIFQSKPGQYIATIQLGNNIAIVIYGIFMARALGPLIGYFMSNEIAILAVQTIFSTFIVLLFAEFLPKALVRINPNLALRFMSVPLIIVFFLLYPASRLIHWISSVILKNLLHADTVNRYDNMVFGKIDLDHLINESQNKSGDHANEDQEEIKLFQNALDFSNVKVRDCMIPRTEIVAMEINNSVEDLKHEFIESGFSKIMIFDGNIDNIVGYVTSKDLFKNPSSIKSRLISVSYIPETMPANKLLKKFIQEHKSVAVVVDEFGGISGMLTIEDIIEEIFGEIEDEHDTDEFIEKKIDEMHYIFSGRLEIDHLNESYNLHFPESDEYDTLAGYILKNHERIPNTNDKILIGKYEFRILKVSRTRIELVQMKIVDD